MNNEKIRVNFLLFLLLFSYFSVDLHNFFLLSDREKMYNVKQLFAYHTFASWVMQTAGSYVCAKNKIIVVIIILMCRCSTASKSIIPDDDWIVSCAFSASSIWVMSYAQCTPYIKSHASCIWGGRRSQSTSENE